LLAACRINQSQNQTCQVKTKPGRSKAQPDLTKDFDFDLAGFVFNLPGLVLTLTFWFDVINPTGC